MKAIVLVLMIMLTFGCQSSPDTVTMTPEDPEPTQFVSVQLNGLPFSAGTVAVVSITDTAFLQITAADRDGLVKYTITQDNWPQEAFVANHVAIPQQNIIAQSAFFADTTEGKIGAVKAGDLVKQTITFLDARGFTKTYEIQFHVIP